MVALEGAGRKSIQKKASKTATVVHIKATGPNIHSNCTANAVSVWHAVSHPLMPLGGFHSFDQGILAPIVSVHACLLWTMSGMTNVFMSVWSWFASSRHTNVCLVMGGAAC